MKNSRRLVSVLTPCYNAEQYIDRLLASVLTQTYPQVEMIVIDDGSTDSSAAIIKSYISKFKERGYTLEYVYQQNRGQSVAVNHGLKLVQGEYLVWPDADDFYASDTAIEKMATALDESDENTSMARVQYNVLSGDTTEVLYQWGVDDDSRYKTDLFEDYLFNSTNSMWAVPGGYMAKVAKIDECIPGRDIYTERHAGQNFQIMLPLLFDAICLTIEEYLYNVVDHPDSHSRNADTAELRRGIYRRTVEHTLNTIPMDGKYRKHLLHRHAASLGFSSNERVGARTFAIRAIKAILPYGLVMLYKRRQK